jgi:hypothetical protein
VSSVHDGVYCEESRASDRPFGTQPFNGNGKPNDVVRDCRFVDGYPFYRTGTNSWQNRANDALIRLQVDLLINVRVQEAFPVLRHSLNYRSRIIGFKAIQYSRPGPTRTKDAMNRWAELRFDQELLSRL